MRPLAIAIVMIASLAASAQLIQFGSNNPDYCLNVEHIKPNLDLSAAVQLRGRITDQTGAPFQNTTVELRRYVSEVQQVSVKKGTTDADGNVDLQIVAKGQYRLLASPSRAFKQPDKLECTSGDKCSLSITLQASPTDLPSSQCPIR
jgi:hypothetical protein